MNISDKGKKQLNETIGLMARMNLFESVERKQVGRDTIMNILDAQDDTNGGCFISLTYVNGKSFYVTKKNWRKPDVDAALSGYGPEGNEHWYPQVKQFNDDEEGKMKKLQGIAGIIMITKYNLHWTTDKSYNRAYAKYAEKLHDLRMKNGVGIQTNGTLGDPLHQAEKSDAVGSLAFSNAGNLEKRFNTAGTPKPTTKFYVIGEDGGILGEIPANVVNSMNAPYSEPKPEKEVSAVLQGEALELYMKEKAELDKTFQGKAFHMDKILDIVATVNGTHYYYINDMAKVEVKKNSGLFVKSDALVNIAKEEIDSADNYDPNLV